MLRIHVNLAHTSCIPIILRKRCISIVLYLEIIEAVLPIVDAVSHFVAIFIISFVLNDLLTECSLSALVWPNVNHIAGTAFIVSKARELVLLFVVFLSLCRKNFLPCSKVVLDDFDDLFLYVICRE
jgi:hypothetical protein